MFRVRGRVEVFLVAADTVRGHRRELAEASVLVAILTGRRGMGAGQRKPVHVLVDLGDGDVPTAHSVTGLTSR